MSESVSQFFHILGSVDQQRGCCEVADGKYEITLYTSCCNVTKGIYYYNTYENHQISAVDMHREDLDSEALICYPVIQGEKIHPVIANFSLIRKQRKEVPFPGGTSFLGENIW